MRSYDWSVGDCLAIGLGTTPHDHFTIRCISHSKISRPKIPFPELQGIWPGKTISGTASTDTKLLGNHPINTFSPELKSRVTSRN